MICTKMCTLLPSHCDLIYSEVTYDVVHVLSLQLTSQEALDQCAEKQLCHIAFLPDILDTGMSIGNRQKTDW